MLTRLKLWWFGKRSYRHDTLRKKREYDRLTADLSSYFEYRLDSSRNRCGTVCVNIGECEATEADIKRQRSQEYSCPQNFPPPG